MENTNISAIRFEHPYDECGIYNSGKIPSDEYLYECMRYRHTNELPNPREDYLLHDIAYNEFCAFKSVDSLKHWITDEEINLLLDFGFRVYKIILSDCRIGEYQILFEKENVLSKTDISENIRKNIL